MLESMCNRVGTVAGERSHLPRTCLWRVTAVKLRDSSGYLEMQQGYKRRDRREARKIGIK